ncbi:BTB/POZ domain-containing protein KCTD12 [Galendromus occidentalis]|uniref:BTB/POZ domain-containing protein KCTD12 n=1 Tax=Galendromus occidentalis TaxID=34638 RepID=A0AAJ7L7I2_9ACAR|nr:BTB/POZ domain-containing protein KCTD12 [Galendromus occidentalis]
MGDKIVELNVGGTLYTTKASTLLKAENGSCVLRELIEEQVKDSQGRLFVDRDGALFRYVLDYLRSGKVTLPEGFSERARLCQEADYFQLEQMSAALNFSGNATTLVPFPGQPGYVTVSYRGTFAFGRDGLADVKFRKLTRILVCGKVTICREVFGDTLNESRDPDRGQDDRYTSRFFLKHNSLEQAFDMLQEARFQCVCACGSGTSCGGNGAEPMKPGLDSEEQRWNHYNEFVFVRN